MQKVSADWKVSKTAAMRIGKQQTEAVILMTACVNPDGMHCTKLQDCRTRKKQYLEALEFYLNETPFKVVFCENSGAELYDEINSAEKYRRLEYLTFYGNDYDKSYGKGYGEARIIDYAIRNSQFISDVDWVIKITGRIKCLNINKKPFAKPQKALNANRIWIDLCYPEWLNSVCFMAPKEWLLHTIERYGHRLDDIAFNFERMLYWSIVDTPEMKVLPALPVLDGICGGSCVRYENKRRLLRKLNHYSTLYYVHLSRGEKINSVWGFLAKCYMVIRMKMFDKR